MFSKQQGSPDQSSGSEINITGGQLSNVQIGGIAGGDISFSGSQYIAQNSTGNSLTALEVVELLSQLQKILSQSTTLSDTEKNKAILSVDIVKDEVQVEEPDREHVAKSLQRVTKILKDADATVEAGTGIWENVQPIIDTIKPWLGIAARLITGV